jgi:ATP-dependent Clp protease ATP-binding subunit ClpA
VVKTDDIGLQSLGLEYIDGPVKPKPEKDVSNAAKKKTRAKSSSSRAKKSVKPKGSDGNGGGGIRTVPKVPLVKA